MSDRPENPEVKAAEEIDPGEPLAELARLEHDVSNDLLVRIRRSVQRRTTTRHLAFFVVTMPMVLLREFWSILISRSDPPGMRKDVSHGDKTS
jgi:hypothetical protein